MFWRRSRDSSSIAPGPEQEEEVPAPPNPPPAPMEVEAPQQEAAAAAVPPHADPRWRRCSRNPKEIACASVVAAGIIAVVVVTIYLAVKRV